MMKRILWAVLFSVLCGSAFAQSPENVVTGYLTTSGCPSTALTPCFEQFGATGGGQTVTSLAPPIVGFGAVAVTTSSATISSELTANAALAGWPATFAPSKPLVVYNISAASVYFCPGGGTCATSGANMGLFIPAGGSYTVWGASTSATIIGASAVTIQVQY
jgi:hypothetical protein